MVRGAAAWLGLCVSGCFVKPDRPAIDGPDDASMDSGGADAFIVIDDSMIDPMCPADMMGPASMPCGMWGTSNVFGSATLTRNGGVLDGALSGATGRAECTTKVDFDFGLGGAGIQVAPITAGNLGDKTWFSVVFPGNHSIMIQTDVTASGAKIYGSCTDPGGFSSPGTYSTLYRYWRVRQTTGSTIAADYSAEGTTWNTMGTCGFNGVEISFATVNFGVSAGTGSSVARHASFDNFTTCTTPKN